MAPPDPTGLTHCAARAYLLIGNISPATWCAPLMDGSHILGRGSDAGIKLPPQFRGVSRRHAELSLDRYGMWILDHGSLAGTKVNGVFLSPLEKFRLDVGDRIWLGGVELEVVSDPYGFQAFFAEIRSEANLPADETVNPYLTQKSQPEFAEKLRRLSPAELEIALWMCRGFTNLKEIGRRLKRSPHTVRTHLGKLFIKLGVHSREELVGFLRRASLSRHANGPTE